MPEQSEAVRIQLEVLEQDQERILQCFSESIRAGDGNLYHLDFFVNGALNRAIALNSGFLQLILSRNLICAGAILRLQLDTAARLHAAHLSENLESFVLEVMKGKHIRTMKDKRGNLMTDRHLIDSLTQQYPWAADVYEKTSSYIHLSDMHIYSAMGSVDEGEMSCEIKIGIEDREWPDETYIEAIQAFHACTEILLLHVNGWIVQKKKLYQAMSNQMVGG